MISEVGRYIRLPPKSVRIGRGSIWGWVNERGIEHRFKKVFVLVDHYRVSVVEKKTGEVLSQDTIDPARSYWTNYLVDEKTKRSRKPKEKER